MSIEATFEDESAEAIVRPEHGSPVAFVVRRRKTPVGHDVFGRRKTAERWVVCLRSSTGDGFSSHTSFNAACRSLLYRARRYDRAYSVPRGVSA